MAELIKDTVFELLRRDAEDAEPDDTPPASQKENLSSFALFLLITLLIIALFTSYILQARKIQAVHETVLSIFAGMVVGLILRLSASTFVQSVVSFDYQVFFNLLLPPIILASGYELHQANFFRNIGSILTFAFAGTFISALVLGAILWLWTRIPLDFNISFVEAFAVGATLSATDPVTILAIFNAYKVDPKLYTVIFGESILNDAIAIVLFETAQSYIPDPNQTEELSKLSFLTFFEAIGVFLLVFFGSLIIGVAVGIITTLGLKFTHVRKTPKIESCLVILIAYASYFFANSIGMSGIVTLLFCGITMKHYAYYNMSRRTQLTTKFVFQVLAQLSENFIFLYLGITLFTDKKLVFKPLFILITVLGICVARYVAVFPLSKLINWTIRFRARRAGGSSEVADELPHSYQVMLFWAGLRGAVGVALAAGFKGKSDNVNALQATVLVVVVLTVIIFGGTTARMLEIMGIKTGVVDEVDSDDEFDIETATNGTYYKHGGNGAIAGGPAAIGHSPRGRNTVALGRIGTKERTKDDHSLHRSNSLGANVTPGWDEPYSSGSNKPSPPNRPVGSNKRHNTGSNVPAGKRDREANLQAQNLLRDPSDEDFYSDGDLPPAAPRRSPKMRPSPPPTTGSPFQLAGVGGSSGGPGTGTPIAGGLGDAHITARGAIRELFSGNEDSETWFKRLDEAVIKPTLLLDQSGKGGGGSGSGGAGNEPA